MSGLQEDTALIKALVRFTNMAPSALAREAGLADTTLSRPFAGNATTRLSTTTLEKLKVRFPDFPGWRTQGAGASVADKQMPYRGQGEPISRGTHTSPGQDTDTVELEQIDLKFGMGGTYADGLVEVAKRPFSRAWLQTITSTAPRHLFWAVGDGDSMEPTIRSGEVLLIDRSEFSPRFDDSIWALVHGEIGMIKRLRMLPGGAVELHSDNQLVRPQVAVDGELHVVGRVIAVVRRL